MLNNFNYISDGISQGYSYLEPDPSIPPFSLQKGHAWHYTSSSSALKILETQSIFSTEFKGLNDYAELIHGLEIISQEFEKILKTLELTDRCKDFIHSWLSKDKYINQASENLYFISFSKHNNTPSQWSLYGDYGYGVCLGFSFNPIKTIRPFQPSENFQPNYSGFAYPWLRVLYKDSVKRKAVWQHIKVVNEKILENPLELNQFTFNFITLLIAATLKDESFTHEKEIRTLYYAHNIKHSLLLEEPHPRKVEPFYGVEWNLDLSLSKGYLPISFLKIGPRTPRNNIDSLIDHCNKHNIKIIE